MSAEIMKDLRRGAGEIAAAGHPGWGNTMDAAHERIDELECELVRILRTANERLCRLANAAELSTDFGGGLLSSKIVGEILGRRCTHPPAPGREKES